MNKKDNTKQNQQVLGHADPKHKFQAERDKELTTNARISEDTLSAVWQKNLAEMKSMSFSSIDAAVAEIVNRVITELHGDSKSEAAEATRIVLTSSVVDDPEIAAVIKRTLTIQG